MVRLPVVNDKGGFTGTRRARPTPAEAEEIAVEALGFIASDPNLFDRFCALTGLRAQDMRAAASEPGFLAGVLVFVTDHEPTLHAFSQDARRDPERVGAARHALARDHPDESGAE